MECDRGDDFEFPELTAEDRVALNGIPADAVKHWWRGERWDFEKKEWVDLTHSSES